MNNIDELLLALKKNKEMYTLVLVVCTAWDCLQLYYTYENINPWTSCTIPVALSHYQVPQVSVSAEAVEEGDQTASVRMAQRFTTH